MPESNPESSHSSSATDLSRSPSSEPQAGLKQETSAGTHQGSTGSDNESERTAALETNPNTDTSGKNAVSYPDSIMGLDDPRLHVVYQDESRSHADDFYRQPNSFAESEPRLIESVSPMPPIGAPAANISA